MAYASTHPKTKKALKEQVAKGEFPDIYSAGMFQPKQNGVEYISGPRPDEPHKWYAQVEVKDGRIVKILS